MKIFHLLVFHNSKEGRPGNKSHFPAAPRLISSYEIRSDD
ncbi:hypothetical protein GCWU000342_02263 [Shuttleworthella satelles DSM 14600]|uniref:Uncharacterized protein n=1 Tax=Shuttleworthella satelles DSM 14600 TaxID=626523 RepID=C4GDT9_9FIRM|nr:hypothetical protein GCWU000342_02263 [Shuttleworthia satelles DSM 14600]